MWLRFPMHIDKLGGLQITDGKTSYWAGSWISGGLSICDLQCFTSTQVKYFHSQEYKKYWFPYLRIACILPSLPPSVYCCQCIYILGFHCTSNEYSTENLTSFWKAAMRGIYNYQPKIWKCYTKINIERRSRELIEILLWKVHHGRRAKVSSFHQRYPWGDSNIDL